MKLQGRSGSWNKSGTDRVYFICFFKKNHYPCCCWFFWGGETTHNNHLNYFVTNSQECARARGAKWPQIVKPVCDVKRPDTRGSSICAHHIFFIIILTRKEDLPFFWSITSLDRSPLCLVGFMVCVLQNFEINIFLLLWTQKIAHVIRIRRTRNKRVWALLELIKTPVYLRGLCVCGKETWILFLFSKNWVVCVIFVFEPRGVLKQRRGMNKKVLNRSFFCLIRKTVGYLV